MNIHKYKICNNKRVNYRAKKRDTYIQIKYESKEKKKKKKNKTSDFVTRFKNEYIEYSLVNFHFFLTRSSC